jgi:HAD superfamily hydrolase (TIGR01509 family)
MEPLTQTYDAIGGKYGGKSVKPAFPFVIFDMDGTLVDSFGLIAESYDFAIGRLENHVKDSRINVTQGRTLEEALGERVPESEVPVAVERFHGYYEKHCSSVNVFPGIRPLLMALQRRGVELAVFTGQTRRATDVTLRETDLRKFFSKVVTANDVAEPKPSPEGLKLAMEGIGAVPEGTVYVGDDPDDVNASRSAGVTGAAALWGSIRREELVALQPDFLFNRPGELKLLSTWTIR